MAFELSFFGMLLWRDDDPIPYQGYRFVSLLFVTQSVDAVVLGIALLIPIN